MKGRNNKKSFWKNIFLFIDYMGLSKPFPFQEESENFEETPEENTEEESSEEDLEGGISEDGDSEDGQYDI